MGKNYVTCLFYLLVISVCGFSQTVVPDPNFEQALIDLGHDSGPLDGMVPTANINSISSLDVKAKNISDLTGIEDFVSLDILNCEENLLNSLDVTQNINLSQLFCGSNRLNSLNISALTNLQILWCDNNQLDFLDLTNNLKLFSLVCNNNPINTLDVSKNVLLRVLSCINNNLSSLNITTNTALLELYCDSNSLTQLNTNNNSKLTILSCSDNSITSLNITNNPDLIDLYAVRNELTGLDVSKSLELQNIFILQNKITSLDITKNQKLIQLWCSTNQLTELNTSKNPYLRELYCDYNLITALDLTNNPNLYKFSCINNKLCTFDVRNNNNANIFSFSAAMNPYLSCVLVDNANYSRANWLNIDSTTHFVNSQEACEALGVNNVPVDNLGDFIGVSYILPNLINGSYFTGSGGTGINLSPGDKINTSQTIYIYNENFCDSNETSFNVLISGESFYIPKFFTPNNDGNHDFWIVKDFTNTIKNIAIFDHYGKLLKSLGPNVGWNGTFNGKPMETNDYWYVITFQTGDVLKGHFTLKR